MKRTARDPVTGRNYAVPYNLTYPEWKAQVNSAKIEKKEISIKSPVETRNPADGTGAGIVFGVAKLSKRQRALDTRLAAAGDHILIKKRDVSMKDLAALTAKTGSEYAVFTKGNQRYLYRGSATDALISEERLKELANEGWRFSGHTHPGVGQKVRLSSQGDRNVLELFGQKQSVIFDSAGNYNVFRKGVGHG